LPAQYLHALFRIAGLGRKRKATLALTRLGHELMPEAQAGRLHALLFRTAFARYNLARRYGRFAEVFDSQIGVILYLIGRRCADWQTAEDVMYTTVLRARELVVSSDWTAPARFRVWRAPLSLLVRPDGGEAPASRR
jgi:hypothetical protein